MEIVKIDFSKTEGKIKPMNAVNNGPAGSRVRRTGNFETYAAARIPYARLHDSAFYSGNYGGEFSVDVHRIFPNFDADENNPEHYIFEPTDMYLQDIESVGTKIFYRLGAAIEHQYKKGTYPPKDFLKWAKICEHIILHYTQGWANGFHMDIEYWEIWNEPDCKNPDGSNPCWQGTDEEFAEFFTVAATYLKKRFPSLKIGGPAFAWVNDFWDTFLPYIKERNVPVDFISYHTYPHSPAHFANVIRNADAKLDKYGFTNVERIYNEWNYVKGWLGEDMVSSYRTQRGLQGASFQVAAMSIAQATDVDMLMYYDARPCAFNGLFETYYFTPLKGYYAIKAFSDLTDLGGYVRTENTEEVFSTAATDGKNGAILLTYYPKEEEAGEKRICLSLQGIKGKKKVEFYAVDNERDLEIVRTEIVTGDEAELFVTLKKYEVNFVKITCV